jgi:hypothetical protein
MGRILTLVFPGSSRHSDETDYYRAPVPVV